MAEFLDKSVKRAIQYFGFSDRPTKGGDILDLEKGGNLSKGGVHLEKGGGGGYDPPYQLWFCKKVNGWKLLTFFAKHAILDVWQGSEYTAVIYYSLIGKIQDTNKIDSVAM